MRLWRDPPTSYGLSLVTNAWKPLPRHQSVQEKTTADARRNPLQQYIEHFGQLVEKEPTCTSRFSAMSSFRKRLLTPSILRVGLRYEIVMNERGLRPKA